MSCNLITFDYTEAAEKAGVMPDGLEDDIKEIAEAIKQIAVNQPHKILRIDMKIGILVSKPATSQSNKRSLELKPNLDEVVSGSLKRLGPFGTYLNSPKNVSKLESFDKVSRKSRALSINSRKSSLKSLKKAEKTKSTVISVNLSQSST